VEGVVRAAGGVLHRSRAGRVEIAIVHRPRHDDWSLPKGKRKRGEHPVVNAHREVWEETGIVPVLGVRLPTVGYQLAIGGTLADKTVDYWAMSAALSDEDSRFVAGDETDELIWLSPAEAIERLSYERDILVARAFAALPPLRPPVLLLRHASAGDRAAWAGPDDERPLDRDGRARAELLAEVLSCFAPGQLVAAGPRRCADTLAPLAAVTGRPLQVDRAFDEHADATAAAARLLELASSAGQAVVICSQHKLIPGLLGHLSEGSSDGYPTDKGAGWLLGLAVDGRLATLDPLD
jgi:8-oxo-dGTP diphosphatase